MDIKGKAVACEPATIERVQRRLLTVMLKYLLLAIVLTLLGCFGVDLLTQSIGLGVSLGFALGWIIAGYGAALGTFVICAAALRVRSTIGTRPAHLARMITVTKCGRLLILLAAVSAETVTILDAPVGMDRHFVMWVNGIIAACLVLFAVTADDVGRTVRNSAG